MAGEWREVRVGDLVARGVLEISDGYRVRNEELGPKGIPFVRGGDIGDGWINTVTEDHIRPEFAERVRAKLTRPGDVAFITKGTVGRAGRLRAGQPPVVFAPQVAYWRVKAPSVVDSRFLFYLIRSQEFQAALYGVKTHGAMVADYVSISQQHDFAFRFPDIGSQRAIAHILGTLDDKIELNRRMNETLEAIARALFKSWFVDFEPVRAKAEGRDPGLSKGLADLFPDSFEASRLGQIPKGWGTGSILMQARLLSGGTPKTDRSDYWDGGVPWASAKDVSQSGQAFLVATERTITSKGLEESATQLVPALSTVIVARGATTGRMVMFGRDMAMNQTCYALGSSTGTPFALYCQLRGAVGALVHAAHGSVFDTITTSTFSSSKVVLAPRPLLKAFERLVSAAFQRMLASIEECVSLATLRETLLPKLISGKVRVKDADRIAGAAT
jgi:type I restriction enzyme S subunit